MELWVKCVHGSLVRHGQAPEGTRNGVYVAAHKLKWCDGPREATYQELIEMLRDWDDDPGFIADAMTALGVEDG